PGDEAQLKLAGVISSKPGEDLGFDSSSTADEPGLRLKQSEQPHPQQHRATVPGPKWCDYPSTHDHPHRLLTRHQQTEWR
ncbi:hypothetical protein H0H92_007172, partial [Tricholoma furcatifolium]